MKWARDPIQKKPVIKYVVISFLIALIGVTLSIWGASWDITSHLLRTPETFFTPSHMILYSGVGIGVISALMSFILLISNKIKNQSFGVGSKLLVIGAAFQIIAGPGDFYWHELFGIDGLLSPTHLILAIGILIMSLGCTIGLTRIHSHFLKKDNFIKTILPITYGVLWFTVMWFIFLFVLPISEGETHNFNPNPYVALGLSLVALPFTFSILFWSISKSVNKFGFASLTVLVFIIMNVTSNIITSEKLLIYLPWFLAPLISSIIVDFILNSKIKSTSFQKHFEKISGSILGSMFFIFCLPMLAMTFLDFYLTDDIFPYDILPNAGDTVYQIWIITIIPGAFFGMLGMIYASRKLKLDSKSN